MPFPSPSSTSSANEDDRHQHHHKNTENNHNDRPQNIQRPLSLDDASNNNDQHQQHHHHHNYYGSPQLSPSPSKEYESTPFLPSSPSHTPPKGSAVNHSSRRNNSRRRPKQQSRRHQERETVTTIPPPATTTTTTASIPTNELLLGTAFVSFMSFAVCQMVFAIWASSEAMVGDSSAMMVDALTYLFNWMAERRKRHFQQQDDDIEKEQQQQQQKQQQNDGKFPEVELTIQERLDGEDERASKMDIGGERRTTSSMEQQQQQREFQQQQKEFQERQRERIKRKALLQLEILPPLISVSALLVVTFFVLKTAIQVLVLDTHRKRSEQSDPNLNIMLIFSLTNLGLDLLNVTCFARAKHLFGFDTHVTTSTTHGGGHYHTHHHHRDHVLVRTQDDDDDDDHSVSMAGYVVDENDEDEEVHSLHEEMHDDLGQISLPGTDNNSTFTTPRTDNRRSQRLTPKSSSNNNSHHEKTPSHLTAEFSQTVITTGPNRSSGDDDEDNSEPIPHIPTEDGGANLNMCSAYTHVFADTLRSIAVIVAALVAKVDSDLTPEEADATAAVIVSLLIALSLIPLGQGLWMSLKEWQEIRAEEEQETNRLLFATEQRRIANMLIV